MTNTKLVIKRSFSVPVDRLWPAFSSPELLSQWWAPIRMANAYIAVNFKEDGLFRYCFKSPEGQEYWGRGLYQSITEPTYLAYRDCFTDSEGNPVAPSYYGLPDNELLESLVEIELTPDGKQTHLTFSGDNLYGDEMVEPMTQSWNSMFNKLSDLIE